MRKQSSRHLTWFASVARALAVLIAAAASVHAAPIVSYPFDTGSEGWMVGSFLDNSGPTTGPVYSASGGNTDGHLHAVDFAAWNAYQAPAQFLGDLSTAYGAILSFDIRVPGTDGVVYSAVMLSDGTTTLQFRGLPSVGGWYNFAIPLLASAGWQHSTDGKIAGVAATEGELQTVLANLQFMHINADWLTGDDYADLDNVQIVAHPEPSTMLLLGSSLAALAALARSRARRRGNQQL